MKISILSTQNIDWETVSDIELARQFGMRRHSVYSYRIRHGLPLGPKKCSEKYKNGGRKKIRDLDHEYSFVVRNGRKKASKLWRTIIKQTYGHKCEICGYYNPPVANHCHHITPIASGGKNTIRNGIVLCSRCHEEIHVGFHSEKLHEVLVLRD